MTKIKLINVPMVGIAKYIKDGGQPNLYLTMLYSKKMCRRIYYTLFQRGWITGSNNRGGWKKDTEVTEKFKNMSEAELAKYSSRENVQAKHIPMYGFIRLFTISVKKNHMIDLSWFYDFMRVVYPAKVISKRMRSLEHAGWVCAYNNKKHITIIDEYSINENVFNVVNSLYFERLSVRERYSREVTPIFNNEMNRFLSWNKNRRKETITGADKDLLYATMTIAKCLANIVASDMANGSGKADSYTLENFIKKLSDNDYHNIKNQLNTNNIDWGAVSDFGLKMAGFIPLDSETGLWTIPLFMAPFIPSKFKKFSIIDTTKLTSITDIDTRFGCVAALLDMEKIRRDSEK